MCGIAGFIGVSKNFEASYKLITELFKSCVVRGKDASGFWGTEINDGRILYHKEPIPSPDFIKKSIWTDIQKMNIDLLMVHARGASPGVGSPFENKNNHPFVNESRSIGLVHNGRIPDHEYLELCKKYETTTSCDSEILLRIFEAGRLHSQEKKLDVLEEPYAPDITDRLIGASDVWAYIEKGHMAVAVGERPTPDKRRLLLFRNTHRSLWLVDLREDLGQIFFCSTAEIWREAYANADVVLKSRFKLIEFPIQQIWAFEASSNAPGPIEVERFEISSKGKGKCDFEGIDKIKILREAKIAKVYTNLTDNDAVLYSGNYTPPPPNGVLSLIETNYLNNRTIPTLYENEPWPNYTEDMSKAMKALSGSVASFEYLRNLLRTLQANMESGAHMGRITEDDLEKITIKLRRVEKSLEHILNSVG